MKMRAFGVMVLKLFGVSVLLSGLLLLGAFRNSAKREQHPDMGRPHSIAGATARLADARADRRWMEAYGQLPLSFEENVGQTAKEVRYVSRGPGYDLFLTPQEAVLILSTPVPYDLSPFHRFATVRALRDASRARSLTAIRMRFEGADPAAQISAAEPLVKKTNYFIGSDPQKWHAEVPSYGRVKYAGVYPGVDLVFYGNRRQLEYDFVVAPGADPKSVRLTLEGARKLRINAHGDVVLSVLSGEVVLQKPVVYQMVNGKRHEIAGNYALAEGHCVKFSVPAYDRNEPLILDPVLNYSTYLGGSGNEGFAPGLGIAVDAVTGNAFAVGTTTSTDFPTTASGFNPGPLGSNAKGEVFITELNSSGTAELYSTYLAGSTGELGAAVALDSTGKVYLTGLTFSSDFPTTANALKQSPNAANLNFGTSFVAKIDPTLSGAASLVYSSYLGGTGGAFVDFGDGIAADTAGNAYVTGITYSSPGNGLANFPVLNAFQATPSDLTDGNAFLTRIDTTKSGAASLLYSTYLGGSGAHAASLTFADAGFGIAVDGSHNAYFIGTTASTDFPTTANGLQTTSPAGNVQGTGFVAKIDTTMSGNASLVYSTYLGGEGFDFGTGLALGPNNVTYVTGRTTSLLFPTTTGAYQTTGSTSADAFVALLDTSKSGAASLVYSTFLGGSNIAAGHGIKADAAGNAYVAGATGTTDFPVTPGALQPVYPGGQSDGFFSEINPGGNGAADLLYSTYFGGHGTGHDQIFAIAIDTANPANAYITGQTFATSATFPVFPAGAFQTNLKGPSDAFIAKLTPVPTLAVSPTSLAFGSLPVGATTGAKMVTLTNNTSDAIPFPGTSVSFSGANGADFASPSNTCNGSIAAGAGCTVSVNFTPSVVAAEAGTLVLTVTITNGGLAVPQAFHVSLTGTGTPAAPIVGLDHANVAFGGQMVTTTSAATVVTLTNSGSAPLNIASIAAAPAVFTQTNTCPASPATLPATPGSNTCTISVKFAPTATGPQAGGTLTITDNAGGSPQSIPLTGTGWDFSLAGPPTTQTVSAAAPLQFNVSMTPLGGFNQGVGLVCTGAPANTTCNVASPVMAADGVTVQMAQVSVTTTAMMLPPRSIPDSPLSIRQVVPLILALMLLLLLPKTKRLRLRLGMVAAMLLLVVLAGCSTSSKQPVNAVLTITGTSNGSAGAVVHKATVNLTVN